MQSEKLATDAVEVLATRLPTIADDTVRRADDARVVAGRDMSNREERNTKIDIGGAVLLLTVLVVVIVVALLLLRQ